MTTTKWQGSSAILCPSRTRTGWNNTQTKDQKNKHLGMTYPTIALPSTIEHLASNLDSGSYILLLICLAFRGERGCTPLTTTPPQCSCGPHIDTVQPVRDGWTLACLSHETTVDIPAWRLSEQVQIKQDSHSLITSTCWSTIGVGLVYLNKPP